MKSRFEFILSNIIVIEVNNKCNYNEFLKFYIFLCIICMLNCLHFLIVYKCMEIYLRIYVAWTLNRLIAICDTVWLDILRIVRKSWFDICNIEKKQCFHCYWIYSNIFITHLYITGVYYNKCTKAIILSRCF